MNARDVKGMLAQADRLLSEFAEMCLKEGVNPDHIERARKASVVEDTRFDIVLKKLGYLDENQYITVWASILGLECISNDPIGGDLSQSLGLTHAFLSFAGVVPIRQNAGTVWVAVRDPLIHAGLDMLSAKLQKDIIPVLCKISQFDQMLANCETLHDSSPDQIDELTLQADAEKVRDSNSNSPAVIYLQSLIEKAVTERASDVHITRSSLGPRVRFRIDGVLHLRTAPEGNIYDNVISRAKVLAQLDISERRVPQDGAFSMTIAGRSLDIRASVMPHMFGEGIVLRILDQSSVALDITKIGASHEFRNALTELIGQPHGLILLSGPTGSGKTTTLYSALHQLERNDRNIVTVEDPVEYILPNISQVKVRPGVGLTFASALRAVLRQDPDVLLIGEIRDEETAAIAVRAALTGHLVLASIHSNSAPQALERLVDLGITDGLLSETILAIFAQRLLRRLCQHCRVAFNPEPHLTNFIAVDPEHMPGMYYKSTGCPHCLGIGYMGRTLIGEVLARNYASEKKASAGTMAKNYSQVSFLNQSSTIWHDVVQKIEDGTTDFHEARRVLGQRLH